MLLTRGEDYVLVLCMPHTTNAQALSDGLSAQQAKQDNPT